MTTTVSNISVTNSGTGYCTGSLGFSMATLSTLSTVASGYGIALGGADGCTLNISHQGEITWTGPLSANVRKFLNSVGGAIDNNAAGSKALEKTYLRALEKCLRQAEQMDYATFINGLREEIEHRTAKLTVNALLDGINED